MSMVNEVSFPGLGISMTLKRTAFEIAGRPVYWYAIIIVCGLLLAWLYCDRMAPRVGITSDDLTDLLIFGIPAGLIGSRLYYVLFYLDLYRKEDGSLDFPAMLRVWDGGVAIYGVVIAGFLTLWLVSRHKKIPFLAFADLCSFGLLIGQFVGRWGNFMNVEAYGGITTLPWRMCAPKIAAELYGQGIVDASGYLAVTEGTLGVHPTFLYESLWNFIGFLILTVIFVKGRRFDGQIFFSYIAWYGLGRSIIEGLRTDSLYLMHTNIRISQLVGLLSALAGIALLLVFRKRGRLWVREKEQIKEEHGDGSDHS